MDVIDVIMDLSDLDLDLRLSLREFVCVLNLASLARQGRPLPSQITADQQEKAVRDVASAIQEAKEEEE